MKNKKYIIATIVLIIIVSIIVVQNYKKNNNFDLITQLSLGEKYLLDQDYNQAILTYNKILEVDPLNIEAYIGLYNAYCYLNNTNSAIEILEKGYELTKNKELESIINELNDSNIFDDTQLDLPIELEIESVVSSFQLLTTSFKLEIGETANIEYIDDEVNETKISILDTDILSKNGNEITAISSGKTSIEIVNGDTIEIIEVEITEPKLIEIPVTSTKAEEINIYLRSFNNEFEVLPTFDTINEIDYRTLVSLNIGRVPSTDYMFKSLELVENYILTNINPNINIPINFDYSTSENAIYGWNAPNQGFDLFATGFYEGVYKSFNINNILKDNENNTISVDVLQYSEGQFDLGDDNYYLYPEDYMAVYGSGYTINTNGTMSFEYPDPTKAIGIMNMYSRDITFYDLANSMPVYRYVLVETNDGYNVISKTIV